MYSGQASAQSGRLFCGPPCQTDIDTLTLIIEPAAAILRGLMRSRGNPSANQEAGERAVEERPLAVRLREAQFSDFEGVAALKDRFGLGKDTQENWCRLWRQNPAMAVAKSRLSMGWVLETKRGIVGYQGSIPLLYRFGDRALIVATGTSLVVEPAYRARSIGLLASLYRQTGVDVVLITTAIPSVSEVSKTLGAHVLPQQDYDTILFWILDPREFATSVAMRLGLKGGTAAAATLLGSLILRTEMRMRPSRLRAKPPLRVTEIPVEDIGDEFQALWTRKIGEQPRLMAERSPLCLRWHFTIPGTAATTAVLCCYRSERLTGYAVLRHWIDRGTGMRKCLLADMLAEQDDATVIASLLEAAYANAVAASDHVLEVMGLPRNIRQSFMARNPFHRKYPAASFLYKVKDQGLAQILADGNAWYANAFDGDTTLTP
jgi:hypothetical protein